MQPGMAQSSNYRHLWVWEFKEIRLIHPRVFRGAPLTPPLPLLLLPQFSKEDELCFHTFSLAVEDIQRQFHLSARRFLLPIESKLSAEPGIRSVKLLSGEPDV